MPVTEAVLAEEDERVRGEVAVGGRRGGRFLRWAEVGVPDDGSAVVLGRGAAGVVFRGQVAAASRSVGGANQEEEGGVGSSASDGGAAVAIGGKVIK